MNAHSPVAERIAPLVGKLGSPHDGELIAAARAIGRQLECAGLGWNDLGAALSASPAIRALAYREPAEDWRGMADHCAARDELLTVKEADFIRTMVRVLRRPGTAPTEKQAKWLAAIFARVDGAD